MAKSAEVVSRVPPVFDQYSRPEALGLDCSEVPTRTKMEFAAECDINRIMERYIFTGELPSGIIGEYGDFSEAPDFVQAQNIIAKANEQFMAMPAAVRQRFENDPAQFLDFVHEPKNLDEAFKLGLLAKEHQAREELAEGGVPPVVPSPP